jgi:hypothetical protein
MCIGTKKGLFVAEGKKARKKFELRGPFGSGVSVYSAMVDHARHAAHLRFELQRLLRHEGPALERPRELVQGDEVRAGVSGGRRGARCQHLVDRAGCSEKGAVVRSRAGRAVPQRDAGDSVEMVEASATTSTRASGTRAPGFVHAHDRARRQSRAPRHLDRRATT